MRAILDGDRIVRLAPHGSGLGVEVGELPRGVGLERLRWTGSALVDLATLDTLYVRPGAHTLHAHAVDGSQPVAMAYADRKRLLTEGGVVRVQDQAEALQREEAREALGRLRATDADMGRVVEDLVGMLLAKGLLTEADLPQAARDKIAARQALRVKI